MMESQQRTFQEKFYRFGFARLPASTGIQGNWLFTEIASERERERDTYHRKKERGEREKAKRKSERVKEREREWERERNRLIDVWVCEWYEWREFLKNCCVFGFFAHTWRRHRERLYSQRQGCWIRKTPRYESRYYKYWCSSKNVCTWLWHCSYSRRIMGLGTTIRQWVFWILTSWGYGSTFGAPTHGFGGYYCEAALTPASNNPKEGSKIMCVLDFAAVRSWYNLQELVLFATRIFLPMWALNGHWPNCNSTIFNVCFHDCP